METCRLHSCSRDIPEGHGNTKYCSELCQKVAKKIRQKREYGFIKDIKNRLLTNCKLFERNLHGLETIKLNYHSALQEGFDQNAYYGRLVDAQITYYCLNNFLFWFTTEGKTNYLHIKRKK